MWRRSVRLAIGTFVVFLLIWVFGGGLGAVFTSTTRDDNGVVLIFGIITGVVAFALRWLTFLSSERQEAISEWCTLLAGRSAGCVNASYPFTTLS